MEPVVSDEQFLSWFDLSRPSLRGAADAARGGDTHAAALHVARDATDGAVRSAIPSRDVPTVRDLIVRHFPDSADLERETAELLLAEQIPSPADLGPLKDWRVGIRARSARRRGNESLILAQLYAITGQRPFADHAVRLALRAAQQIEPFADQDRPAAYPWHPHATSAQHTHDTTHMIQYWMLAWSLLGDAIGDDDRLAWMKAIVRGARDRFKANRDEVPHNLTLHPLMAALQVAVAFPALRDAPRWVDHLADRLERDFAAMPFITPDGYAREGNMYQDVNTRLLTVCWLTLARGADIDLPGLKGAAASAYAIQSLLVCPDGSSWWIGDCMPRSHHEHWQEAHEALHLGAALFGRPEWKAAAGSVAGARPEMLNLWLMGPDGIERWLKMPPTDVARRAWHGEHAPQACFHGLRCGHGVGAHAGILAFNTEHNHAHSDKGQVLIYGLGRHLISDPGHAGHGPTDMLPLFSTKVHACVSPIRRTPLGPRTDWADYASSLGTYQVDGLQVAMGDHRYFENHVIRRALALVTPWGEDGDVFWVVWDRVDRKRGWPGEGNEPLELIDTAFPFHAPGCGAAVSSDRRSAWSLYDGPGGPPFSAGAASRRELSAGHEQSDSDANIQVTRLIGRDADQFDVHIVPGQTMGAGGGLQPRPVAVFRWRGRMPMVGAYVLVPYAGMGDEPFARVTGTVSDDGMQARVEMPRGPVSVSLSGLMSGKLTGAARR